MDRTTILEAVARGWCHPETESKIMDVVLANAITTEVVKALQAEKNEPKNISFTEELRSLVNRYSMEQVSNTPDFILATYLVSMLRIYEETVCARDRWHGRPEK